MKVNHGLQYDFLTEEQYVLGGVGDLGGEMINPRGDWRDSIPTKAEQQNFGLFEPFACTNFTLCNMEEILYKYIYGQERDFSDRWFAKKSGTDPERGGNSPHTVAEFRRKNGLVYEHEWPYTKDIKTLEEFYKAPPKVLDKKAKTLTYEVSFKHQWVTNTPEKMYAELKKSPLGFGVYAWEKDNGLYVRKGRSTHYCTCVYAEWGKYWLVLDTYKDGGSLLKRLSWDHIPDLVKSIRVSRDAVNQGAWYLFLYWFNKTLGWRF